MAYTQTDLDTLDAALANSNLTVRAGDGRLVTYRSTQELLAMRSHVAAEIARAAAGNSRVYPRYQAARFDDE